MIDLRGVATKFVMCPMISKKFGFKSLHKKNLFITMEGEPAIALTVRPTNVETKLDIDDDDNNNEGEEEESEMVTLLRKLVREELTRTLVGGRLSVLNDAAQQNHDDDNNDDNDDNNDEDIIQATATSSSQLHVRSNSLRSVKSLIMEKKNSFRRPSSSSTGGTHAGGQSSSSSSVESSAASKLAQLVDTLEALDAVVTPERPSSVCGFLLSMILPIVFVIYLMVRKDFHFFFNIIIESF